MEITKKYLIIEAFANVIDQMVFLKLKDKTKSVMSYDREIIKFP